jgi:hypothetical protein
MLLQCRTVEVHIRITVFLYVILDRNIITHENNNKNNLCYENLLVGMYTTK